MKRRDLLLIPAAALGVMIANVAISFGMVWVYATFIDPGQPLAHYRGLRRGRRADRQRRRGHPADAARRLLLAEGPAKARRLLAAGAAALLYIVRWILAILLAAGADAALWLWAALSHGTKLLAALAGAALRGRPAGSGSVSAH